MPRISQMVNYNHTNQLQEVSKNAVKLIITKCYDYKTRLHLRAIIYAKMLMSNDLARNLTVYINICTFHTDIECFLNFSIIS